MKKHTLFYCLFMLVICSLQANAQQFEYSVASNFDQPNDIRCYLSKAASRITHHSLDSIHNLQDWQSVRERRYAEFLEMMGLNDVPFKGERPPLNIEKAGTIQEQGFRIEKLYYESLPGLYVPANLYIPDGITAPVPAILYVCGHAHTQKHHYQAHARKFAQLGFVCLIIETIQYGEVRGEHWGEESRGWFHWYSRGYTPGGVELWNGIRGLDLLSGLPEVDQDKLGVTGISGGGSQTWYLAAADPRVKASVAVAGAGSLEGQIAQRTIDDHCDCMMPINTYSQDFTDIGALIAPRAFMIAQTTGDGYYSIEAVRELYEGTKKIYDYYDQPDNLQMIEASGGHSYGENGELRPPIFSFFVRELMNKNLSPEEIGDLDDSLARQLSEEELKVYVEGVPKDDRTTTIQDSFIKVAPPPQINSIEALDEHRTEVVDFLENKTFGAFPSAPAPLDIKLEFKTQDFGEYGKHIYSFVSEEGWRLKVSVQWHRPPDQSQPVLLVLRNPDEGRWASAGFASGARDKMSVAYFEARGIGETGWAPNLQWHIRRSAAWTGRTIASMRVYDVLRCMEALRTLPGIDPEKINLAAQGEMAATALYAALLDDNVNALIVKDPPSTQNAPSQPNGRGEAIEMLNCLRITDLPLVAGLLYPTPFVAVGDLPDTYQWAEALYKNLNEGKSLTKIQSLSEWKP